MTLTVTEMDVADDEMADGAHAVIVATVAHDSPDLPMQSRDQFVTRLRTPSAVLGHPRWIARLDGATVGFASLMLPTSDFVDQGRLSTFMVHPAARRRGVGRAMFAAVHDRVRVEGRRSLVGTSESALPGGVARPGDGGPFAFAMGAREALRSSVHRLDIAGRTPDDDARLAAAVEAAGPHAVGYQLVRWGTHTPDEMCADVVEVYRHHTLGPEATPHDVARLRAEEDELEASGFRCLRVGARHVATGRIVGMTEMLVRDGVSDGHQGITLIVPEHRGHRLALLALADNLRQIRATEPHITHADATLVDPNERVLAVKHAIGYRPHRAHTEYRLEI